VAQGSQVKNVGAVKRNAVLLRELGQALNQATVRKNCTRRLGERVFGSFAMVEGMA
jgi:hypothetical protein